MKKILNKIPITLWTLILISISVYVISEDIILFDTTKVDTLSKILTIIGVYYLAIQVRKQTKTEQISNEFLNQSNFKFNGFCAKNLIKAQPCLCSEPGSLNYNQCSDNHWFNITQVGNLPAKNLNIILIHDGEQNDISQLLSNRSQVLKMVYQNDEHQFKLSPHAVPLTLLNPKQNSCFYILLEYESVYTKVRYKRIYELCYAPSIKPEEIPITWIKSIYYFSLSLSFITDSETVTWKETIKNYWNKTLKFFGVKTGLKMQDWLIDI